MALFSKPAQDKHHINLDNKHGLLLFDVIERIEIALRTKLIYFVSRETDPWWFEDGTNFKDQRNFIDCLSSIDRELDYSKDTFIKEHFQKYYSDSRRPPSLWCTISKVPFLLLI